MIQLKYIGSIRIASEEQEKSLSQLSSDYSLIRKGNFVQVFGPTGSKSISALRDPFWNPTVRDVVSLFYDTKRSLALLAEKVGEFLDEKEIPDVVLNGITALDNGHVLEVLDTFRDETLRCSVVWDPESRDTWLTWRATSLTSEEQEIEKEGSIPFSEDTEEAEKVWEKVAGELLKAVKSWSKGRE